MCPGRGGDTSLEQRDEEVEEGSASPRGTRGDTTPLPRTSQASPQEDFGSWARSHTQQVAELLRVASCLLRAHCRSNKHLAALSRGVQSMSRSLGALASAVGTILQPCCSPPAVPNPSQDPQNPDWPTLPSDLLELFPSSVLQGDKTTPGPAASPPAPEPPASPPRSVSPRECPCRGKPSSRPRKRRKK